MAINLYGYNTQRITGISSNMDTETIVNNMMAGDQARLDKLFQQKEKAQWKYDAYTELNTAVASLRNNYLSILGDKSLMKSSAYNAYKVSMAENSAVKVTGTASALPTSFKILSAVKATAASVTAQVDTQQTEIKGVAGQFLRAQATGSFAPKDADGNPIAITADTTIGDLAEHFGLKAGDKLSFGINGETFTFGQDVTLSTLVSEVNDNENAKVTMDVDYATGAVSIKSDEVGKDTQLSFANITGTAFGDSEKGLGLRNGDVQKVSILGGPDAEIDINSWSFGKLMREGLTMPETTMTINGHEFELLDKPIQAVMDEVNNAGLGLTMSYDKNAGTFVFRNNADGNVDTAENAPINVSGGLFGEKSIMGVEAGAYNQLGNVKRSDTLMEMARKLGKEVGDTLSVTINGKEFSFNTKNTTLSDMMYKINRDKDAGAVFSYSEMTDSFQISNANTGANEKLSFSGLNDLFGLADAADLAGTDAKLKVVSEGITKEINQASNSFTLDGLSFEITADADFTADGAEGLQVGVERDYQPTIDAVKSFIEDYNKLVGDLTTKYYEKTYSAYPPLTQEQRDAISEKEAEKWDEKAKSGILRNDPVIGGLLNSLRSALYTKVGDTGMSANDLGISTVAWSSDNWRTEQGKLTLDEDKLLAALQENPNAVQEVFTKISTNDDGSTDTSSSVVNGMSVSNSGLLTRMNAFLQNFNMTMRSQNISDTQKAINGYTERMSDLIVKMAEKEERYWAKYSQMETLLTQMQSQQNWLTAQLGLSTQK